MQNEKIPPTVVNFPNQQAKHRSRPKSNAKVGHRAKSYPMEFDIYNQFGQVISNDVAANYRDATVYIGLTKIECGSYLPRTSSSCQVVFHQFDTSINILLIKRLEHLWSTYQGLFLIETTLNYFTRFSLMLVVFQSFHQPTFFRLQQMKLSMQTSTRGLSSLLHQTRPCVQFAQDLHSTKIGHPQFVNPTIQLR